MTQDPEQPQGVPEDTTGDGAAAEPTAPGGAGPAGPADPTEPVDTVAERLEHGAPGTPGGADAVPDGAVDGREEGDLAASDELAVARMEAEERLGDLQRLQAEFVNYKRRVERDRELVKQNATYAALAPIVEVLDTIDRAREHEELQGGLRTVAEQLERAAATAGLTKFGAPGDAFDPTLHEALSHAGEDPGVSVTTCQVVAKSGYRIGDRVVRAAQVLVVDPPA